VSKERNDMRKVFLKNIGHFDEGCWEAGTPPQRGKGDFSFIG